MNLRQPYEQLIADKLRKLPAPDADASWQQMKRILDDDEETRAGGKRPPGNGWWRIGILAIVLSTSLWLYVEKTSSPGTPLAKNNTIAPLTAENKSAEAGNDLSKNANSSNKNQTATIDNNTTLENANTSSVSKNNDKTGAAIIDKSNTAADTKSHAVRNVVTAAGGTDEKKSTKTTHSENSNTAGENIAEKTTATTINKKDAERGNLSLSLAAGKGKRNDIKNTTGTANTGGSGIVATTKPSEKNNKNSTGFTSVDNKTNGNQTEPETGISTGKLKGLPATTKNNNQDNNQLSGGHYLPVNQTAGADEKTWFEKLNDLKTPGTIPSANTSLALGDSIETSSNTSNLLSNETKKAVAKAQRDKALEDMSKKEKKLFHLDLSNVFKPFSLHIDADPRWAAGIALNSGITVNAQSRYNYNMNAKGGTLTDYIPSLYLQFHLNDYVYAQTEINFISPQYTPRLLVYQQTNDVTAMVGISQQKSIYIQKLYYFNLPVSLHYSPVNNFYFSAGVQFSSFQSGLVSVQNKQYTTATGPDHPTSISNSIVKFKDDSIAAKLSPNEWRWQAGADYYWNRFSVGLRYNRSFKDLLNVNLSSSLPPTSMRNESLIFFVRYNLFESRKKGEVSQKN